MLVKLSTNAITDAIIEADAAVSRADAQARYQSVNGVDVGDDLQSDRFIVGRESWKVYLCNMQVTVEIPDEFTAALLPTGEDAGRKLLEDHTAQAYREGRLTMEQVRRILGYATRMQVDPFLLRYGIFDYTAEDLDEDLSNLRRLTT